MISEPLLKDEKVTFYWRIRAQNEGKYAGRVWLYLRYIPKEGGAEERRAISAQTIEVEARKFLGILSSSSAKRLGVIGTFLGVLLIFSFANDANKFRRKKSKK